MTVTDQVRKQAEIVYKQEVEAALAEYEDRQAIVMGEIIEDYHERLRKAKEAFSKATGEEV